jgi:hypothetical protein
MALSFPMRGIVRRRRAPYGAGTTSIVVGMQIAGRLQLPGVSLKAILTRIGD